LDHPGSIITQAIYTDGVKTATGLDSFLENIKLIIHLPELTNMIRIPRAVLKREASSEII